MKKLIAVLILLSLVSLVIVDYRTSEGTLKVETAVTDDKYRYYGEENKVGFPATRTGEKLNGSFENYEYENTSVKRWTAMNGVDKGIQEISRILEEEFGPNATEGMRFWQTGHETREYALELVYDTSKNQSYSYQEFNETLPERIEATVHYKDHSNQAVIPVKSRKGGMIIQQ